MDICFTLHHSVLETLWEFSLVKFEDEQQNEKEMGGKQSRKREVASFVASEKVEQSLGQQKKENN